MDGPIHKEQIGLQLQRCRIHYMTSTFDPTNGLDLSGTDESNSFEFMNIKGVGSGVGKNRIYIFV